MEPLDKLIEGSEKLTAIFGEWPSFHDAEIVELHLDRGEINPDKEIWEFPILTVKLMLWRLTSRVSEDGLLISEHHSLVTIQFHSPDKLTIAGINHQNAIYELKITPHPHGPIWKFDVEFVEAFGLHARFNCSCIRILSAIPWDREKRPPSWLSQERQ